MTVDGVPGEEAEGAAADETLSDSAERPRSAQDGRAADLTRGRQGDDDDAQQTGASEVGGTIKEWRVAFTGALVVGESDAGPLIPKMPVRADLLMRLRSHGWSPTKRLHSYWSYDSSTDRSGQGPDVAWGFDLGNYSENYHLTGDGGDLYDICSECAVEVEILRVTFEIYDLGVAVITAQARLSGTDGYSVGLIARLVKELTRVRRDGARSRLGTFLETAASGAAELYLDELTSALCSAPHEGAMTQPRYCKSPTLERRVGTGRLLWLHPVHLVEFHNSLDGEDGVFGFDEALNIYGTADKVYGSYVQEFSPVFHEVVQVYSGTFVTGIGASAVLSANAVAESLPLRLTSLHWAYYALYMELDRDLLEIVARQDDSGGASLKELERDAEAVFGEYRRAMAARVLLDSVLIARGGDELAVWEAIARVQRFESIVQAVERKIEVLTQLASRRVNQASADVGRRSIYLAVLTFVCGALIAIVSGSGLRPLWLTILVAAAVAAAPVLVFVRQQRLGQSGWPSLSATVSRLLGRGVR